MASFLFALSVGLPLAQIGAANRTWLELPGAVEAGKGAIGNSFGFAALAATVVILLGLVPRRGVLPGSGRSNDAREFRRSAAGNTLLWLPFFVPGVLLGIALIWIFNRPGLAAFYQSAGIVVLSFVIRYFALGWTAARHAIDAADADLADVARLEGATRWQMLHQVLWPQMAPQVLAAWYVVYLLCLWDVESMVLVVPPGGETLALRIFNLLHYGYAAQVNALCLTLLGLAVTPLLLVAAFVKTRQFLQRLSRKEFGGVLMSAAAAMVVLLAGCAPPATMNEASLKSRIFNRAEVIGSRGVGLGEFNKPRSVAVDLADNVYAVDMTGRVQ
jgi:ABC-type Fe3+ transport system permease subunit